MRKLPIGIQTLAKIREDDYAYVDKSHFVKMLADTGSSFFLSRPRRFGKSLFLDTLKEAFEGNRKLFAGLYLEHHWDWAKKHPVIRISFGSGVLKTRAELDQTIRERLAEHFRRHGFTPSADSIGGIFREFIIWLHDRGGPVVILIDEYDKPILDNITEPDRAVEMREGLKNFYSVIKDADPYLRFVFLTGVSKFSKVSLFSGLNNLKDLTLDPRTATICGYTQRDLETVFAEHLVGHDLDAIKRWYNGYSFLGEPVYNPFDVLQYLDLGEFRNFWFETGTPTFLLQTLEHRRRFIPELARVEANESMLASFDVGSIELPTLLFQTGYLTITESQLGSEGRSFVLGFPNHEVRTSLHRSILGWLAGEASSPDQTRPRLERVLRSGGLDDLHEIFHAFFATIPHDWYRKNQLAGYEGYYASIVYCYFVALGLEVIAEDVTNHGRIDLTVKHAGRVYLFEFKVKGLAGKGNAGRARPMTWLLKKNYHEKYRPAAPEVYLVGVEFDPETRNIKSFEWRRAFG